jgi:hypothetical protein
MDLSAPKKTRTGPVDEFKLIDPDQEPAKLQGPQRPRLTPITAPATTAPTAKDVATTPVPSPQAGAPAKRAAKTPGRVRARERRGPQTLEETLEILGAGDLEIDNGSGETLNESGVRHLRVEVQKNTPFSRLLDRLSERVRKP